MKLIDGRHETDFAYDGFDRRVRIIETENGVGQSNKVFLWDDDKQIAQRRDRTGATVGRNYFANGFEAGGKDYYYTKDHLDSIREVVASDGTTVEAVYDYSPWGEVTKTGGSGVESDFLYTGHFYHDESDLHLTLYRAYNPKLGMWLSRDPIAENGGINLYAYVGNNPVNWWDPYGLNAAMTWGGRIITGGLITTQVDSPAPGPADAIGLGVAATGAAIWGAGKLWDWAFNSDKADECDSGCDAESDRNPADDKLLGKKAAEEAARDAGYRDVHDAKAQNGAGGRHDLYKGTDGNVYIKPKGGKGPGIPL